VFELTNIIIFNRSMDTYILYHENSHIRVRKEKTELVSGKPIYKQDRYYC